MKIKIYYFPIRSASFAFTPRFICLYVSLQNKSITGFSRQNQGRGWMFLIGTKSLFKVDQRRPVMGLIVHAEVNKHCGNISFVHSLSQDRTFKNLEQTLCGGFANVVEHLRPQPFTWSLHHRQVHSVNELSGLKPEQPHGRRSKQGGSGHQGARSVAAMTSSQALHETSINGETFGQR